MFINKGRKLRYNSCTFSSLYETSLMVKVDLPGTMRYRQWACLLEENQFIYN